MTLQLLNRPSKCKKNLSVMLIASFVMSAGGCVSVDVGGYNAPGVTLDQQAAYFIIFSETDDRGLHELLATDLRSRGIEVKSGFADRKPAETDVVIKYGGQWKWDVTWYLLDLQVGFYEVENDLLIASANAFRTSLGRKAPEAMVREAMDKVFGVMEESSK